MVTFNNYSEDLFAYVQQLANTNKKVCAKIGCTDVEPLPTDTGEAADDEIWISIDKEKIGLQENSKRIHLQLDLNNPHQNFQKIQSCFDKIVLDINVLYFLHNDPFRTIGSLLRTGENSIFITESHEGYLPRFGDEITDDIDVTKGDAVPIVSGKLSPEEAIKTFNEKRKKYLETLFTKVQLVTQKPFPYKHNYSHLKGYSTKSFYILCGFKQDSK